MIQTSLVLASAPATRGCAIQRVYREIILVGADVYGIATQLRWTLPANVPVEEFAEKLRGGLWIRYRDVDVFESCHVVTPSMLTMSL